MKIITISTKRRRMRSFMTKIITSVFFLALVAVAAVVGSLIFLAILALIAFIAILVIVSMLFMRGRINYKRMRL